MQVKNTSKSQVRLNALFVNGDPLELKPGKVMEVNEELLITSYKELFDQFQLVIQTGYEGKEPDGKDAKTETKVETPVKPKVKEPAVKTEIKLEAPIKVSEMKEPVVKPETK